MARAIIIVLDSLGVGELPYSVKFGDIGANTLNNIRKKVSKLNIPNLIKLGIYNIRDTGLPPIDYVSASYGKCNIFDKPFPDKIIKRLEKEIDTKIIGNYPALGTEIIASLGNTHKETGYPIVYLSSDTSMQIAMHEEIIPLERQYEICLIARDIMSGYDTVNRIICRPFLGSDGKYYKTKNKKCFSITTPHKTVLDLLSENGKEVISVGKIEDIFNEKGITEIDHTKNNEEGIIATIKYLEKDFDGLLFVNLVDFDTLYSYRNDTKGYAKALEYFDNKLPEILNLLKEDDILIITADHGCDPTIGVTDHTREYIPLLVYGHKTKENYDLGIRNTFSDIAATVADFFGYSFQNGTSFLREISK